ncbi:MAG TPA: hypothetical protein VMY42_28790, partial [Thermoguttaceae bacterium]|nr:hypothetical protein [Thermoguttaceae bacterium]
VSGDPAIVQMVGCGILSGAEGSWTHSQLVGGAGAVAPGVQRVTLASNDPAVTDLAAIEVLLTAANVDHAANETLLTTIDADTGAMVTDLAAIEVLLTAANVDHAANEALLTTIDADTGAMVTDLAAIEVLLTAANVDHAANEVLLGTIDADTGAIKTAVELIDNAISGAGFNITQFGGAAVPIGAGVEATAVRVTLATDSTGVVSVDDGGGALTVDGTVTANAGTNLNTSALALEAGGNLADIKTAVQLIDNPVSGNEMLIAGGATQTNDVKVTLDSETVALAANSGVDIGDVDVTSIAAGTNTIGGVIAQPSTSAAYDGTTSCTIKRASGLAASGTTAIVAAVVDKKIRVLALQLIATSATVTNVYLANADNNLLGDASNPIALATDADGDNIAGLVMPWNPGGWFETDTANEALNLVLSAAQDVIYALTYIEVA